MRTKGEGSPFPYKMTRREFNFCIKYLETGFDFNAAIDHAYNYSKLTKKMLGYKLFHRPKIRAFLKEQIQLIMEQANLSSAAVLKEVSDILEDRTEKASDRLKAAALLLDHMKTKNPPASSGRNKKTHELTLDDVSDEELIAMHHKFVRLPKGHVKDHGAQMIDFKELKNEADTEHTDGTE